MKRIRESLENILRGTVSSIDKIDNVKNFCCIYETDKGKFFVKLLKERNLRKEVFGISYFGEFLGVDVPEIINSTEEVLITKYENSLEEISAKEIVSVVLNYQNDYWNLPDKIKDLAKINRGFPRFNIDKDFEENENLFENKNLEKISKVINSAKEEVYENIPKVVCHGDLRRRNVFMKNGNMPFLLDFEKVCFDYPTFDISTLAYSSPEETLKIFEFYNSEKPLRLNEVNSDSLKKAFLSDTMRIAIYDTIYSSRNRNYETRKEHNNKVINNLNSLVS